MANEITLLDRANAALTSRNDYHVLFLYTPTAPISVGGSNVVPTPTTSLSALALQVLSQQEESSLNSGDLVAEVVTYTYNDALTPAENLTNLQAFYAERDALFQTRYARKYEHAGTRFNAV